VIFTARSNYQWKGGRQDNRANYDVRVREAAGESQEWLGAEV